MTDKYRWDLDTDFNVKCKSNGRAFVFGHFSSNSYGYVLVAFVYPSEQTGFCLCCHDNSVHQVCPTQSIALHGKKRVWKAAFNILMFLSLEYSLETYPFLVSVVICINYCGKLKAESLLTHRETHTSAPVICIVLQRILLGLTCF